MKLNTTDIQGFVLRGYNMPFARYLFLQFESAEAGRAFLGALVGEVTTGQRWKTGKPAHTTNIAITFKGFEALELPQTTLASFPVEFQQGMRARGDILGDTGPSAFEHWDPVWHEDVHACLFVHALSQKDLEDRCNALLHDNQAVHGVRVLDTQDAAAMVEDGKVMLKEHFGFTDGFGNPDYANVERSTQPGQGKLMSDGSWSPLATGELLLGYVDEAGELPASPNPAILAANGTFMVYRKLHQNVGTFHSFLDTWARRYGKGDNAAREKLAAKFIGRWRDGTPLELSPDTPDANIAMNPNQSTNFTYGKDLEGVRCPIGAHMRRVNPRDAFGFGGDLINRRRITRRGMPYGPFLAESAQEAGASKEQDAVDRGIIFIALNASLARQFEFVQQQWISYGNDAHLGNEKDLLFGTHEPGEKYSIQGDGTADNPPLFCTALPNFVEVRGGDYLFIPSLTGLNMLAMNLVDPR